MSLVKAAMGRVLTVRLEIVESIQPLLVVAINLILKLLSLPVWLSPNAKEGFFTALLFTTVPEYIIFQFHTEIVGVADVVLLGFKESGAQILLE